MPEVQDTAPAARGETGAVDDVRAVLPERLDHRHKVPGVVLEIGVLDHDELTRRGVDAGADRGALAAVRLPLDEDDPVGFCGGDFPDDLDGSVGGSVVHDHDLDLGDARNGDGEHAAEQFTDQESLVVDGDDDAEPHPLGVRLLPVLAPPLGTHDVVFLWHRSRGAPRRRS